MIHSLSSKHNLKKAYNSQQLQKTVRKPHSQQHRRGNLEDSSQRIESSVAQASVKEIVKQKANPFHQLNYSCDYLINSKYVPPNAVVSLIQSIRNKDAQQFEMEAQRYGVKEDLNALIQSIKHANQYSKQCWDQFEQEILKRHEYIIDHPKMLRQLSIKKKILIFKDKESELFHIVSNFGYDHQYSQKAINSSTYQAFREGLSQLCQRIKLKKRQSLNEFNNLQTLILTNEGLPLNNNQSSSIIDMEYIAYQIWNNELEELKKATKLQAQFNQPQSTSNYRLPNKPLVQSISIPQEQPVNPFKPIKLIEESKNTQIVNYLLIFISEHQIKNISVIDQQNKTTPQIQSTNSSYINYYYTIAYFNVNRQHNYKMQLNLSSRRRKQIKLNIKYQNNLLIMVDKDLQERNHVDTAINKSIFQAVQFVCRFVVKKELEIYAWLRLFYYSYKRIQEDGSNVSKMFHHFINIPLKTSQYLLCFFHAVYGQNSRKYYLQSPLRSYLKFPKYIYEYKQQNYAFNQQLTHFYFQIHLFNLIEHNDVVKHRELIKSLILLNIKHQREECIVEILRNVADKVPNLLMEVSIELKKLFREKNICTHDYFLIKLNYIQFQIEKNDSMQQKILMDFVSDMIDLSEKCTQRCAQKQQINEGEIRNLFTQWSFFKGRTLRITDQKLTELYAQTKILSAISNNNFEFTHIISPYFNKKHEELLAINRVQTFLSALIKPLSTNDQQLLKIIFKKGSISAQQLQQMIKIISLDRKGIYDGQRFKFIVTFLNIGEVDVILRAIDEYYAVNTVNQERRKLLYELFKIISTKITVVQRNNEYKIINQSLFKQTMRLFFSIRSQPLNTLIRSRIVNILSIELPGRQQQIIENINNSFQQEETFNQNRIQLINFYLQNRAANLQ